MVSITVHLSDKVLTELTNHMKIRGMTGEAAGICDALLFKMLIAIEKEETDVTVRFKEEV